MSYPLARNGIFASVQGEGAMLGMPMVFVRLAGCSVGCPLCDTDYRKVRSEGVEAIAEEAVSIGGDCRWAWITGGEPADHDLPPLANRLKLAGFNVAVATSGHKELPSRLAWSIDWLSVSPHDPEAWQVMLGEELKIIPGLNGYGIESFLPKTDASEFRYRFVSPCDGLPNSVARCFEWVRANPGWRMTVQAQKQWGLA